MSSASATANTANTIFNVGIIVAIVVSSVMGLCMLICVGIFIYCLCCRKPKAYPGAVVQVPPYPGTMNQPGTYGDPGYYSQPMNKY